MITRVLIMECAYCPRSTRLKGAEVTEAALVERAAALGWTRVPDPKWPDAPFLAMDHCPKCAKKKAS